MVSVRRPTFRKNLYLEWKPEHFIERTNFLFYDYTHLFNIVAMCVLLLYYTALGLDLHLLFNFIHILSWNTSCLVLAH